MNLPEKYDFFLDYTKEKELMRSFLEQINYEGDDKDVEQCIYPVVFRIVNGIILHQRAYVVENKETLLKLVNVKNITSQLINTMQNLIPHLEIYLPHLDTQAEAVKLFCDNYIIKLLNKVQNEPEKIERFLKLIELDEKR